ncbi:hypothetical protein BDW74DRAFT_181063 [Aspergillus multicolor]|uniref:uncharacterized protein n=1 Tax=Aspergillus multicolor TaxID=41759 RepID=UPI003CCDE3B8
MQFKNILLSSVLALGAAASASAPNATNVAGTLLNRFAELDIGYQDTVYRLNHLAQGTGKITANDVVSTFNKTVSSEAKDLSSSQPSIPFSDAVQLVLCQSAHSVHLSIIAVSNAFTDNAAQFNADQRNTLQDAFTKVNDETGRFVINVASKALPVCLSTIQTDDKAINKALVGAVYALDPSEASS